MHWQLHEVMSLVCLAALVFFVVGLMVAARNEPVEIDEDDPADWWKE